MILRLCVERYVSFRKQPLFLYIRHIRNNLHMFSASGESFCAVVRTGAGICFPADGCTGGYCRTDTYVCIGFRRSREAAGNVPADLFQQPLPSSFYAKGRNSCRYAALRNRRSHENPPPSGRRGDYMLKVLYDRMVRDVEILVLREYHRATVFETPADESCPRVFATTRGDKVFVTMQ